MVQLTETRVSVFVVVEHALENTTLEVIVYQGQLDVICDVVGKLVTRAHTCCDSLP